MNEYKKLKPFDNDIIDKIGSNNVIAKHLSVSAAAISYWRKNGIPELRMIQLKVLFPKAFK